MGSVVDVSQINSRDGIRMEEVIPKSEPNPEGSSSSSVSTPEPDGETVIQDPAQRQKRKGGRKPIYATSEERKQRNRQAQAAFRERRTEYIKQLETTIKHNEETLHSLQQSHRSAADECLMLRYKNSLLERILLEKGIDVQAELRLKSGSLNMPPAKPARQSISQNSPLSRTAMNRQSVNRHKVGMPQKLDQSNISQAPREDSYTTRSPQLHPTPVSHVSSPSTATKSPGFRLQGCMSPPGTETQQQHNIPQLRQHQRPPILPLLNNSYSRNDNGHNSHHPISAPPSNPSTPTTGAHANTSSGHAVNPSRIPSAYYLSPFQKHYDQLGKLIPSLYFRTEQEYDAQADMIDDEPDLDDSTEGASYTPNYHEPLIPSRQAQAQAQAQAQQQNEPQVTVTVATPHSDEVVEGFGRGDSFFDHFDPMLDADPFGLTASMHFQTPFSYIQNHARP
ncbi:hypothetical protein ACJ72_08434 [Emergomyces africanus]|uniref:BZIP domain-containing protein n=1 Tax=Emergomyces africanus TaxID=1955775 RepID=A0A1B7NL16_9EURO|nr:hypothetical protein ACJ72_08434 [Emergomyces africanus]